MKEVKLSDDIALEVYDLRSYNNNVIRESINAMFKIADELKGKVLLVGGWSVYYVKEKGRISNKEYQGLFGVSKPTASRELDSLVRKGILERVGVTGRGTYYVLKGS